MMLRASKKLSVFRVRGLKILGRIGTHIPFFFFFFFYRKNNNFMHFERHLAFQNASKLYFFPENLKKF